MTWRSMDEAALLDALAGWVGRHGLAVYAAGLLLVLLGSALLWRGLHRWIVPSQASRLPPGAFLLTRVALGFSILLAGAWGFAEIAEALGGGPALGQADERLSTQIGLRTPRAALQVFALLTHLGSVVFITTLCTAVALLLIVRGRRWLAAAWVIAIAGNGLLLNPALKLVFARARPVHDPSLATAPGYSFPSGHSSSAVVAYGMLAYVALRFVPPRWHLAVALAAAGLAWTIGCSRVFLRVHFATDVIAGFASGFAWLAVCVTSVELTRHYRRRAG